MARVVVAGLCVALPVGALYAPLVHAHLDGHHEARAVHAHIGGHAHGPAGPVEARRHARKSGPAEAGHDEHEYVAFGFSRADEPAVGDAGDSEPATRLQIFVAVQTATLITPALPPSPFTLAPDPVSVMRLAPDEVRSHGPPASGPSTPRAPPFLSV
jgi:hypothetical protein